MTEPRPATLEQLVYEFRNINKQLDSIVNSLRQDYVRRDLYEVQQRRNDEQHELAAKQSELISDQLGRFIAEHEKQRHRREEQDREERQRMDDERGQTKRLVIGAVLSAVLALLVNLAVTLAAAAGRAA